MTIIAMRHITNALPLFIAPSVAGANAPQPCRGEQKKTNEGFIGESELTKVVKMLEENGFYSESK